MLDPPLSAAAAAAAASLSAAATAGAASTPAADSPLPHSSGSLLVPPDFPLASLLSWLQSHLVPAFFLLLGVGSVAWLIGFNFYLTKARVMRAFRSLGVNSVRTRRAFTELKRKSFHLLGLLIPSIYYLGLRYSNGVLTQSRGVVILGIPTFLLWVIEVLRWISPVFRGHYNRIFSSMLRAQEKAALAEEERILTEGSFAHQVDQLVEAITTPLLGELPASPSSPRNNNGHAQMEGMHTRGAAAAAAAAAAASAASAAAGIQSASSKPLPDSLAADYSKSSRAGPIPLPPIARDSPRSGALHSSASSGGSAVAASEKSEKVFTGTGFFFLGCWLSVVWFTPTIGTASMLNLVLGDMSAAIVGISWGSLKIGKKSLEGTLAMFGVCCMIGSIFFSSGPQGTAVVVVLASLTATMVELLGPEKWWCDDNITIPLSTGIAYTIAFNLICGGVPKDMS